MTEFFLGFVFAWSVIDGDTIKVSAHVWPNVGAIEERVRLVRIDAPEVHAKSVCERELAAKATDYVKARMASTWKLAVRVDFKATRDSFGRILGDVLVDGVSLSDAGLAAGVFRPYADRAAGKAWC